MLSGMVMPSNPAAYIARACDVDNNGYLVVAVRNNTKLNVTGVEVTVQYNEGGRAVARRFAVRGTISGGQVASVNTQLGPYNPAAGCPATVTAGRVAN